MRHVVDVLFVVIFFSFSFLGILRPSIVVGWAKSAHPEFIGDETPLLFITRIIGFVGLAVSIFFAIIIFRSFQFP